MYTLLHEPDAFRRYISGSGLVEHTTEYLSREAELMRERNSNLNATVYVSVGERERDQVAALHQFVDMIGGLRRPNLELSTEVYPSEGHSPAGIALTYLRGMRTVYPLSA